MLQILLLHIHAESVGIKAKPSSYNGKKKSTWGKTCCHIWREWTQWGCTQCTIRGVLSTNRGVVWCAFKVARRLHRWKPTSKLPSKSMLCGGRVFWCQGGGLRYQKWGWKHWKSLYSKLGFSTNLWWLSWSTFIISFPKRSRRNFIPINTLYKEVMNVMVD